MKLIVLPQAKIDGEDCPKVTKMQKVAINVEEILAVYVISNKFDHPIKGVSALIAKPDNRYLIAMDFDDLMEVINQSTYP